MECLQHILGPKNRVFHIIEFVRGSKKHTRTTTTSRKGKEKLLSGCRKDPWRRRIRIRREEGFEGDEDDYVALDNEDEEWRRFTIDFAFYFAFLSLSEDLNFKHSIVLLLVSNYYFLFGILHF